MSMSISRRNLVKGAAAGIVAGACAAPLCAMAEEVEWDYEADVVVCGCGTSGSAAAVQAADEGAEVIVIEQKDWLGGQLHRCGGGIAAAGSQVQKKFGIEDNADDFFDYWMALSGETSDPELVRVVVDESAGIIDWVIDDLGGQPLDEWELGGGEAGVEEYMYGPGLNIGMDPSVFESVGMEPVARCHWFTKNADDPFCEDESKHLFPTAGGTGLWATFEAALADRGVEPLASTSLERLVTSKETGEVIGVVALQGDAEITIKARKGVVVATGNFASNHEMFKNYCGWDFENSVNGGNAEDLEEDNDGTGIKALLGVGCQLVFPSKSPKVESYDNKCAYSYMCGGVKIDTGAHAIDVFGETVPRLYVASMAAGGVMGDAYPVCGSSVVRNLVFGRIAGKNAAQEQSWE